MLLVAIMLLTGLPAALAEGYDIVVTQADGAGVELNGMDLDDQLELGEDAIIDPNYGDERQMTQALGYATSNSYAMKLFY